MGGEDLASRPQVRVPAMPSGPTSLRITATDEPPSPTP